MPVFIERLTYQSHVLDMSGPLYRLLSAQADQMRNGIAIPPAATLALQNGVDIKAVSGMPGHYSAGFTSDTYTHVTTPAQLEAANIMGGVLTTATPV